MGKIGLLAMVILLVAACMPHPVAISPSVETPVDSEEIDLKWLRKEVERTLQRNKVTTVRSWNGTSQTLTYHAPYLRPIEYPPNWPSWLHWLYKLCWQLREPFEVRYPHQWFWDSCAHAIVLSHSDTELAKEEIESLLYTQREDGFIPHLTWNAKRMHWVDRILQWLYLSNYGSPYLQPPALAVAVERIYQESGDLDFVREVLPKLKNYYLYIDRERVRGDDGLPEIIISYESKDRSPEYDIVYGESNTKPVLLGPMTKLMMKYVALGWDNEKIFASNHFRVKDVLFCSIYAQNLQALSRLCDIGDDEEGSELFAGMAQQTEASILSKMYDEETGLFYSLDAREGKDEQIKVNTISCLMPLILDSISQEQVEKLVNDWLYEPNEFWTDYPVPVEPLSSGQEEGDILWRGSQTWVYTNWYIEKGLRKQAVNYPGLTFRDNKKLADIADELTRKTYWMVKKEGFREYYAAQAGRGSGAYNYGWTTLILDMVFDLDEISP